jgi:tetratricopeptide (TPR) repeat protein
MSAQEPELEVPEVEELNSPFHRKLALIVTALALFGGIVVFAAVDAESQAEQITSAVQRSSIVAMSDDSAVITDFYEALQNSMDVSSLQRDGEVAKMRVALLGLRDQQSIAKSWEQAASQISNLSVLSGQGKYANNPTSLYADLLTGPDLAQLRQQAAGETAASWTGKRNLDIGIVTLIAVALTLIGLSLTVQEGIRKYLLIPAVFIVCVCLAGFIWALSRPTAHTPDTAMKAVVTGDRLYNIQDYDRALSFYTQALRIDPDYAVALVNRATATMLANSPDRGKALYVFSTSTKQAYEAAIRDLSKAVHINADDYLAFVNLGAAYFHVQDYAKAAKMSQQAIDLNPGPALPWLNLGLGLLGQGSEPAGVHAYEHAIGIVRSLPQPTERAELFSSAVTELEILAAQQPPRLSLVRKVEGMVIAAEAAERVPDASPAPLAEITKAQLTVSGPTLYLHFVYTNLPAHARTAWIVYFRPRGATFWTELAASSHFEATNLARSGAGNLTMADRSCPTPGDYRVDIYAGTRRLATATASSSLPKEGLTPYDDVVDGVDLCRPASWEFSSSGPIVLTSPDKQQQMTIRVTTIPSSQNVKDGASLIGNVLGRMTKELSARATVVRKINFTLGGVQGVAWALRLPDNGQGFVWASRGTDGILRTAEAKFPAGNVTALNDITAYLLFT